MPLTVPPLQSLTPPAYTWTQERPVAPKAAYWGSCLYTVETAHMAAVWEAVVAHLSQDNASGGSVALAQWASGDQFVMGVFEQGKAHRASDALETILAQQGLNATPLLMAWSLTPQELARSGLPVVQPLVPPALRYRRGMR